MVITLFAGFGGAAGYTAAIVVVGFNFKHKRNLAMGLAISGKSTKQHKTNTVAVR